jgi:hypothetical protein
VQVDKVGVVSSCTAGGGLCDLKRSNHRDQFDDLKFDYSRHSNFGVAQLNS